MNLVLIETAANQAFIFATNKLRENVGASELTARAGTQFVLEALQQAGGSRIWDQKASPQHIREALLDASRNPPLGENGFSAEVLLAVSGKALLLVRDEAIGQRIVREVTLRALKEAPGLEVRGVVGSAFDFDTDSLHQQIKEVHRQFEAVRSGLPGPAARFQRLPIIAECASSGLPAAQYDGKGRDPGLRSAVAMAKRGATEKGLQRIRSLVGEGHRLPWSPDEIEDLGCDWLAIVHADGNGLGQVFLDFDQRARTADNRKRDYIDKLRRFSLALDECTERAFCSALADLRPKGDRGVTPIVPLVLGGDDLTVVCDGRQALQFTKKFIDQFETQTRQHPAVSAVLENGVTSCAGVAIIKPHFPFFAGYQLAEELLQSAKKLAKRDGARPVSAVDYHILYDASGPDLERIRRELTVDGGSTLLVGRPYVTTAEQGPVNRRWSDLVGRIAAVRARDGEEDCRRLPNSMLHELREALFLGRKAADARLRLVLKRYRTEGLDRLFDEKNSSLFWEDDDGWRTALLDAVDTAEFWEAQS